MTSNKELVKSYLRDAEYSFEEARKAFEAGLYHRSIRRCQEAVDLSLKALLRYLSIEYPRVHDVGSLLYKIIDKLPREIRDEVDFISRLSMELASDGGPAFYGDENRLIPPNKLYTREYAFKRINDVGRLLNIVFKVVKL